MDSSQLPQARLHLITVINSPQDAPVQRHSSVVLEILHRGPDRFRDPADHLIRVADHPVDFVPLGIVEAVPLHLRLPVEGVEVALHQFQGKFRVTGAVGDAFELEVVDDSVLDTVDGGEGIGH